MMGRFHRADTIAMRRSLPEIIFLFFIFSLSYYYYSLKNVWRNWVVFTV